MPSLNIYLHFGNNCQEAFDHYKSVFGGKFQTVMTMGDMPPQPGQPEMSERTRNKLIHISLPIGKGTTLMGSDMPDDLEPKRIVGNNFTISVTVDSEAEADKIFNGLAQGGNPHMPMAKTFWSPYFGMVDDKYGIGWMVGIDGGPLEK